MEKRIESNCQQYNRIEHLKEMLNYLAESEQINLQECADKLTENFPNTKKLSDNLVLMAYSGGKDSSYMVSYVRLIQLLLFKKYNDTFKIRIITYRHCGVPQIVMENIHHVYSALKLYNDPYAEMLLYDDDEVSFFDKDKPVLHSIKNIAKRDVLMSGHLCYGDGRPTFCNSCNISYVNSLVAAASFNNINADVFITGDSTKEMEDYCKWVRKLARNLIKNTTNIDKRFRGFNGYRAVDEIAQLYFKEIYLDEYKQKDNKYNNENNCEPKFFSIYDYTNYDCGSHWEFLTKYLGFQFDTLSFSFTESDCTNPALMAHIRGLKAEHIQQRDYENGILDYLQLAIKIMEAKKFPEHLILKAITRYLSNPGMEVMRKKIQDFCENAYGISEEQLVCMVFSPFCNKGLHLMEFLEKEHPDLCVYINIFRHLLSGKEVTPEYNTHARKLSEISGLDLADLCVLYKSEALLTSKKDTIMKKILKDDPNKIVIQTRNGTHGKIIEELISGR
ncbi:hypothetical protein KYB31_21810 [Clostridium felsineum]|nr:hypothetical protein [Clostridium felsineum]MCR3761610.1 hypothetical protein [Clostridium felsineum]